MKKKLLGYVGVDSGQLIITDPCYIDSEWKNNVEFQDIRAYQHLKKKLKFMYLSSFMTPISKKEQKIINKSVELFTNYDAKTSTGKSINEMIENKEIKDIKLPQKTKLISSFSYAGICETTMANKHQINYKKGHPGVAIAFCSGYGDGTYPVHGTFNKEGRCVKVEIDCNPTKEQIKFFNSLK